MAHTSMKLSVIVPVYNEIETVQEAVERVRAVPIDKEIIIIDNCSTDGTRELIQEMDYPEVRVILQKRNMMKGNSVRKGIAAARGEYSVIQDGDLEYNPQDFVPMLELCRDPEVLAVLGSRIKGARERNESLPASSYSVGRELINKVFRILFRSSLTDVATCYKMTDTGTFQSLDLRRDSFDLDFEIAAKLQMLARRRNQRVAEVPIDYFPRGVEEGKKIRWTDGLHAISTLFACRFGEPVVKEPPQEERSGRES